MISSANERKIGRLRPELERVRAAASSEILAEGSKL